MEIQRLKFGPRPYIFVERECAFEGPAIAAAMESGFGEVYSFAMAAQISPQGMPMSVYLSKDCEVLRFRAGFLISEDDIGKVAAPVLLDRLPDGECVSATHVGPYSSLNESHRALELYVQDQGLEDTMPVWEIFVDDPTTVEEAACRTEIYRAIA